MACMYCMFFRDYRLQFSSLYILYIDVTSNNWREGSISAQGILYMRTWLPGKISLVFKIPGAHFEGEADGKRQFGAHASWAVVREYGIGIPAHYSNSNGFLGAIGFHTRVQAQEVNCYDPSCWGLNATCKVFEKNIYAFSYLLLSLLFVYVV